METAHTTRWGRTRRRLELALLSLTAVLFVACGDTATDMVVPEPLFQKKDCEANPDDPRCDGGGGGREEAKAWIGRVVDEEGVVWLDNAQMLVGKDSKNEMYFSTNGSDSVAVVEAMVVNFDDTEAAATDPASAGCTFENGGDTLVAHYVNGPLDALPGTRAFGVTWDKTGPDGDHMGFHRVGQDSVRIRQSLKSGILDGVDRPISETVSEITDEATGTTTLTLTYSGGIARLQRVEGKSHNQYPLLECPNLDTVTVTLVGN